MLIKPSIDDLESRVEDRSTLALLAAARARDILKGKRPITEEAEVNPVSQAAKEISEGLIGLRNSNEEGKAEREDAE